MNKITDSLKKRYFYKLFANGLGLIMGVLTQSLIPRGLGPRLYGDFNFLTNFFSQFFGFFDMGNSMAFYTKLSQRHKEPKLVSFYFYFIGLIVLIVIAFVVVVFVTGGQVKLWPNQPIFYIWLAILFSMLTYISQIMGNITDAYGLTVPSEVSKTFQKIIGLFIIAAMFLSRKLNIVNFFFYNYVILLFLIIFLAKIIKQSGYFVNDAWRLSSAEIKMYTKEFYYYSHPLFVYSLIGFIAGIFDRWLLQVYGGSIQQGFFSLSSQVGVICFMFSGTMMLLITREFSLAYKSKNLQLMASIFRKHIPLLYSMTAFLACFIAINADKITLIIGGGKFEKASLAVAIMAFFPIHQTYGQLSGSVFYATGQTRLYRNIGIVFLLIGLPLTYFLIAPKKVFGLDLGAEGLAIKTILIQFIGVNVQLYFNSRFLKLSFLWYLKHQIISVMFFLTIASFTTYGIEYLFKFQKNIIFSFLLSGFLYTIINIYFVYSCPAIIGVKKQDVNLIMESLKKVKYFWRAKDD